MMADPDPAEVILPHSRSVEQRAGAPEKLVILVAASQGGANGIETYTQTLVRGLMARGHRVVHASRNGNASDSVWHLPPRRGKVRRVLGAAESLTTHRSLVRTATDIGADIIHATYPEFTPKGFATAVTAWHTSTSVSDRWRTRLIHGEHGRWSGAVFAMTDLLAYARSSVVVGVTQQVVERVIQAGYYARWIPPFIMDECIAPPSPVRDQSCLLVSRWLDDTRKGLPLAVAAVAELRRRIPAARLVLVGGFHDPSVAEGLPEFCEVRGVLERSQISNLARSCGCQLVPSLWEEFGYVVLEGLASGIPVLCSPLPATEDIVSQGLRIVSPRDVEEWAAEAEKALESPGTEFPREFLASTVLPQLEGLYTSAARGR